MGKANEQALLGVMIYENKTSAILYELYRIADVLIFKIKKRTKGEQKTSKSDNQCRAGKPGLIFRS